MKYGQCARCGKRLLVPDDFDLGEDMTVCFDCEHDLLYRHDEGGRE